KSARPEKIIATCRNPSEANQLQQLASEYPSIINVIKLELREFESYDTFLGIVKEILNTNLSSSSGLSLLINNAAIYSNTTSPEISPEIESGEWILEMCLVNAVAPLVLTRALLPMMQLSASIGQRTLIVNI